jgi:hypothetical protein
MENSLVMVVFPHVLIDWTKDSPHIRKSPYLKGIIMFKFTMGFAIGVFASPIIMPVVANKLNDVLSIENFRRVSARTRNSYIR